MPVKSKKRGRPRLPPDLRKPRAGRDARYRAKVREKLDRLAEIEKESVKPK